MKRGLSAEVIKYEDYVTLGSEANAKKPENVGGRKRLCCTDGDIMHFRFNV
ncbi:MAG: DUF933 domain-containing protein [Odoribacter splanchnicus]